MYAYSGCVCALEWAVVLTVDFLVIIQSLCLRGWDRVQNIGAVWGLRSPPALLRC